MAGAGTPCLRGTGMCEMTETRQSSERGDDDDDADRIRAVAKWLAKTNPLPEDAIAEIIRRALRTGHLVWSR